MPVRQGCVAQLSLFINYIVLAFRCRLPNAQVTQQSFILLLIHLALHLAATEPPQCTRQEFTSYAALPSYVCCSYYNVFAQKKKRTRRLATYRGSYNSDTAR